MVKCDMFGIIEAIKSGVVLATSISKISSITKAVNIAALTLISSVVFNPKEQTQTEAASPLVRANISEYVDIINNISSLVLNMSQGIGFGLSGNDIFRKYGDVGHQIIDCQCPYEETTSFRPNVDIPKAYVTNMTIAQCIICTKATYFRSLTYPTFLAIDGVQQFDRNNKTLLSPNNTMIVIQEGNVNNALTGNVFLKSFGEDNVYVRHNASAYKFGRTPEPMQYMLMLDEKYQRIAVIDMLNKNCSDTDSQSGLTNVTLSNFERGYGMGRVMSIVNVTKHNWTVASYKWGLPHINGPVSFRAQPIAPCVFLDNQYWKHCSPDQNDYYGRVNTDQDVENGFIFEQYVEWGDSLSNLLPPSIQIALAHTVFKLLKFICIANAHTTRQSEEHIINYCLKVGKMGGSLSIYHPLLNINEPIFCNDGAATYPSGLAALQAHLKPCW